MAGIKSVLGARLYIGSRVPYKSRVAPSDFVGQSWIEIGEITTLGNLGVTQEMQSETVINDGITRYKKSVIGFDMMENVVSPVPGSGDAGHVRFRQAQASCHPFAFKLENGADCADEATVTISIAAPGVVSWASHGLAAGTPVMLATTGTLPTGLVAGTTYFIAASPAPAAGTFSLSATLGGAAITTTGSQTGIHTATAQPIGETELFFGLATKGPKTYGDASATRGQSFAIQPICESIQI